MAGEPPRAPSRRRRRPSWRRGLLAAVALLVSLLGILVAVGVTRGFERVWRFLAVPSLESRGGRKYTPSGAVKRYIEKLDERQEGSE